MLTSKPRLRGSAPGVSTAPRWGLAREDRAVAGVPQSSGQGRREQRVGRAQRVRQPVHVPLRALHASDLPIRLLVLPQRPVRHAMTGRRHAGHQADARGGAHAVGVGRVELGALAAQAFDVGRAVTVVPRRALAPERFAEVLPAEVVDEEEDDVGVLGGRAPAERSAAGNGDPGEREQRGGEPAPERAPHTSAPTARSVLRRSIATVTGPTPPGTGVM